MLKFAKTNFMPKKKEKEETLDDLLASINKEVGEDSVFQYGNFKGDKTLQRLSTGTIGLDFITGGGWVKGAMNYLVGFESSGKSTVALLAMAQVQKEGGLAAYIDQEYSFDSKYAEKLGVNVDDLVVSQPDTIEQGYNILLKLANSGKFGLVVFDSIAAAIPEKELEGEVKRGDIGSKAGINSATFPKICNALKKSGTIGIFINQYREKIGISYGSPLTEPGGNAVKFFPSIKVELRQSTKEKEEDGSISGNLIKATCKKNKTAPPFRECSFDIVYNKGISRESEIIEFGVTFGIVDLKGSWYSYEGTNIGQGRTKTIEILEDNVELAEELEAKIYSCIKQL